VLRSPCRARSLRCYLCAFTLPLSVAGLLSCQTADAALRHQYTFGGANVGPGGTFEDLVGNADGKLFGNATISGGELILPGGGAGITGDHARLLADGADGINIFNYNAVTFSTWATTTNINDLWARYFDIGFRNVPDANAPNDQAANSIFATINALGNFPNDPPGSNAGLPFGPRFAISNVNTFGNPVPRVTRLSNRLTRRVRSLTTSCTTWP